MLYRLLSYKLTMGMGLLGLVLLMSAPAQASALQLKPEVIDKSTLRFQQTHFEHQRLEQATLEQSLSAQAPLDQPRFEQLRARLLSPQALSPQRDASQHQSPQRAMENAPIDNTPSTDRQPIASIPASGTYLYGQQPIANHPGTTYFVFEAQGVEVSGALYMPSSSFDCVQGQIKPEQIALNVVDSYSQERFSYALPLTPPFAQVANQAGTVAIPPAIEGFYSLPVQESDRNLLATCQAI